MADYDGILIPTLFTSDRVGGFTAYGESVRDMTGPIRFSSDQSVSGSYSRELRRGERQSVWIGVDAGERTITVKCYAPGIGSCLFLLIDHDTGEILDRQINAQSLQWETLTCVKTLTKGVYIVRFVNAHKPFTASRSYWDDLNVE